MKKLNFLMNMAMVAMSLVVLSCLVSIMALFMGAGQAGADLQSLMYLQIASVPVALAAILLGRFVPDPKTSDGVGFKTLYAAVPQWMVFCLLMLNLLVAAGEIAFYVVARMTDETIAWTAHAPLVSMFACSLAVCVLYARAQLIAGRPQAFSGRWAP